LNASRTRTAYAGVIKVATSAIVDHRARRDASCRSRRSGKESISEDQPGKALRDVLVDTGQSFDGYGDTGLVEHFAPHSLLEGLGKLKHAAGRFAASLLPDGP
jgi:hypothetical protein